MQEILRRIPVEVKNLDIFYYLVSQKRPKTYENELFIERNFNEHINIEKFYLCSTDDFNENSNLSPFNEPKFDKYLGNNTYEKKLDSFAFSLLYSQLRKQTEVELLPEIKGELGKTTALLLSQQRTIWITDDYNQEDILNLLTKNGYKVNIVHRHIKEFFVYSLSSKKTFHKLIEEELIQRKQSLQKVKSKIKNIKPSNNQVQYLSLDNKEGCTSFFQSLTEEEKRALSYFFTNERNEQVIIFVESFPSTLMKLKDRILEIELLLKSYLLLYKYQEENRELIQKDRDRPINTQEMLTKFKYKNRFSEYVYLLKELNKRYRDAAKWVDKFYEIAKTGSKINNRPVKDSLHYQAALEASEEISKLWFVSEVSLFGSVAKGIHTRKSDVDLAYKVGIDIRNNTKTRNETFDKLVKGVVHKVELKYEELLDEYPIFIKNDFFKKKKPIFNIIGLSFQTKTSLKMYEKTGFFENAIQLIHRESFTYKLDDIEETVKYSDIDYVIASTNILYTYVCKTLKEDENFIYLKLYKFESIPEENEWYYNVPMKEHGEKYIGVMQINKSKYGFGAFKLIEIKTCVQDKMINQNSLDEFFLLNDYKEYGMWEQSQEFIEIYDELQKGGFRKVKQIFHLN